MVNENNVFFFSQHICKLRVKNLPSNMQNLPIDFPAAPDLWNLLMEMAPPGDCFFMGFWTDHLFSFLIV